MARFQSASPKCKYYFTFLSNCKEIRYTLLKRTCICILPFIFSAASWKATTSSSRTRTSSAIFPRCRDSNSTTTRSTSFLTLPSTAAPVSTGCAWRHQTTCYFHHQTWTPCYIFRALSDNNIARLMVTHFEDNPLTSRLYLHNNDLSYIEDGTFDHIGSIGYL